MAGEEEAKSAGETSTAVAELATEAIGPLEEELRHRVSVEFGDRDRLAIESALLKAFISGMQAAMDERAEVAIDDLAAPAGRLGGELAKTTDNSSLPLPRMDPWAARYSDG